MLHTFSNSPDNSKPLTNEMLKEMIESLNKFEPPKAMLLMPALGGYSIYEVEQRAAKEMLNAAPTPAPQGLRELEFSRNQYKKQWEKSQEKLAALREAALNAVEIEDELDGPMPNDVYNTTKSILGADFNRIAMTEILREVVKSTKENIHNRIAALASAPQQGLREAVEIKINGAVNECDEPTNACGNCNAIEIDINDKYCWNCGTPFKAALANEEK